MIVFLSVFHIFPLCLILNYIHLPVLLTSSSRLFLAILSTIFRAKKNKTKKKKLRRKKTFSNRRVCTIVIECNLKNSLHAQNFDLQHKKLAPVKVECLIRSYYLYVCFDFSNSIRWNEVKKVKSLISKTYNNWMNFFTSGKIRKLLLNQWTENENWHRFILLFIS